MALVSVMESDIRDERKRCAAFLALDQWDETMRTQRGNRPTLTIDQLRKYKKQVVNDWRRNRLGIKISPADALGSKEMAELIEGDIRQSEYISKAHIAYDWAL